MLFSDAFALTGKIKQIEAALNCIRALHRLMIVDDISLHFCLEYCYLSYINRNIIFLN